VLLAKLHEAFDVKLFDFLIDARPLALFFAVSFPWRLLLSRLKLCVQ
jgi:hypothetical protein